MGMRTTTTTTLSTTSSFTKESLLRTEANPYLSIDMDRFSVIPAVPGSSVAATEARPRAAKTTEVSSDDNIPSGFSPVPAVPAVPRPRARQPPPAPLVTTELPSGNNQQENVVSQNTNKSDTS